MQITANDPHRKSWLHVEKDSDFPIQNIPFGVFITKDDIITIGTRIGNFAIDLGAFHQLGYFEGIPLTDDIFMQDSLNDFIADGRKTWRLVRNRIAEVFDNSNPTLQNNEKHKEIIIFNIDDVEMLLPVDIGDYTNFCSSKYYATNLSKLLKGSEHTINDNWYQAPLGYHGRSSSVVVSGTRIRRPNGQLASKKGNPVFGPSSQLDMEIQTAFITTAANNFGEPITVNEAEEYIFGLVLLNNWSARDIEAWEANSFSGPFLGKNFATSISPWIVTLDALQPYKCKNPVQETELLPYLKETNATNNYNIHITATLKTPENELFKISETNFNHIYWTMAQQLAHHTSNGCNVRAGDLMGIGTISGPNKENSGTLFELTNGGNNPIKFSKNTERTYFYDGDQVIVSAYCKNENSRIGFGKCKGKITPSVTYNL